MADVFTATLTGEQEVPPVATTASGIGTVIWDPATGTAAYEIKVKGLDFGPFLGMAPQTADPGDDVTSMHVHNAPRGVAGPVVFGQVNPAQDGDDLSILPNASGSWTVRGIWEPTDPAAVPITSFADALTAAAVGSDVPLYFNVHSTEFPDGEIRGQWVASGIVEKGTKGDDTITAAADGGILIAYGRVGNDTILGGDAADEIKGGSGNDLLGGGGGDDALAGGTDADVFEFLAGQATGQDTIRDFESGIDVVRLVGFAAGFDPLAHLVAVKKGTALDFGDGDQVVFPGRAVTDFSAADFVLG